MLHCKEELWELSTAEETERKGDEGLLKRTTMAEKYSLKRESVKNERFRQYLKGKNKTGLHK